MIQYIVIAASIFSLTSGTIKCKSEPQKPNIIIIIADDLGYNDVGFHGSNQIPTPNIDALGYFGIILNKHYSTPLCTPSRTSLMTGKYAAKTGMQHLASVADQPYGLGLQNKLLSQYMKEAGYMTHLIGKWDLGFYRKNYTPTRRGFDTHKGYLSGYINYWDHTLIDEFHDPPLRFATGLDMRCNLEVNYNTSGIYATDLFTNYAIETIKNHDKSKPMFMTVAHLSPHAAGIADPLQAPLDEIEKFHYIKDPMRRIYAAMVSRLDTGIGKLIDALKEENLLSNTIILFLADNGAPSIGFFANSGSNGPLRGQKGTPFEGGVRTNAAIWSPLLKNRQRVSEQLIYLADWLPTFVGISGVEITDKSIDGIDMWNTLSYNLPSPRTEVLCNIDQDIPYVSFIQRNWKYISGSSSNGTYEQWLGELDQSSQNNITFSEYAKEVLTSQAARALLPFSQPISKSVLQNLREKATIKCGKAVNGVRTDCNAAKGECLFNLLDDPCEMDNLADRRPIVVEYIKNKIRSHISEIQLPRNKPGDPRANPANFNNTWTWWYDELNITENE